MSSHRRRTRRLGWSILIAPPAEWQAAGGGSFRERDASPTSIAEFDPATHSSSTSLAAASDRAAVTGSGTETSPPSVLPHPSESHRAPRGALVPGAYCKASEPSRKRPKTSAWDAGVETQVLADIGELANRTASLCK